MPNYLYSRDNRSNQLLVWSSPDNDFAAARKLLQASPDAARIKGPVFGVVVNPNYNPNRRKTPTRAKPKTRA